MSVTNARGCNRTRRLSVGVQDGEDPGALEYQACDDKVCFNPTRVPISFVVSTKGLARRPPG